MRALRSGSEAWRQPPLGTLLTPTLHSPPTHKLSRLARARWRAQILPVPVTLPPYALPAPVFRFRNLATLAGRAPIGGAREVALACFVAARLANDCCDPILALDDDARAA